VPEDLVVVGLGDQEFAANLNLPLSTVRIDGTRIGRIAADLVVGRTEGKSAHANVVDVGFALVERQGA
jgi:LacI family gluconate utilization system Gnt-I transcriptional repressor